jgi:hypothetical protein
LIIGLLPFLLAAGDATRESAPVPLVEVYRVVAEPSGTLLVPTAAEAAAASFG